MKDNEPKLEDVEAPQTLVQRLIQFRRSSLDEVSQRLFAITHGPVCVRERGAWGREGAASQALSLLSDTRTYISLTKSVRGWVLL